MAQSYSLTHLNIGGQLHFPSALVPVQMSPTPNEQGAYLGPETIKASEEEKNSFSLFVFPCIITVYRIKNQQDATLAVLLSFIYTNVCTCF